MWYFHSNGWVPWVGEHWGELHPGCFNFDQDESERYWCGTSNPHFLFSHRESTTLGSPDKWHLKWWDLPKALVHEIPLLALWRQASSLLYIPNQAQAQIMDYAMGDHLDADLEFSWDRVVHNLSNIDLIELGLSLPQVLLLWADNELTS